MVKENLKELILRTTKKAFLKIKTPDFEIEILKNKNLGDFSTSLAFVLAKGLKKSPKEVADIIAEEIKKPDFIEKIETKNGFINFWIKKEWLMRQVDEILKQDKNFGSSDFGKGKKIIV